MLMIHTPNVFDVQHVYQFLLVLYYIIKKNIPFDLVMYILENIARPYFNKIKR